MKQWLIVLLTPGILLPGLAVVALLAGGGDQERASRPTFPDFVYSSATVESAYRLAVEHHELFAHIPCYCGCGAIPQRPHGSLLDCFLNSDGSFNFHASGCNVCTEIAVDAVRWRIEGRSPAEVRSQVEVKYGEYGLPTSTDPIVE